jgi:hypothetical protein
MDIVYGFGPWIILWTQGARHFRQAAVTSLLTCVILNVRRLAARRMKVLEIGTLIFFVVVAALGFTDAARWLQLYAAPLSNAALGTIALISILLRSPFITQYGKEREPERLWNHPLFLRTTRRLSWLWGCTFMGMAFLQFVSPHWPALTVYLRWVAPYVLLLAALAITIWYPKYVRRRNDEAIARSRLQFGEVRP